MVYRGRMRIVGVSALLLLSTGAHAQEIRATMAGSAWNDAAFVAAGTAGIVVGSWVLRPNGGDHAPLDGLGHRAASTSLDRVGDTMVVAGLFAGASFSSLVDRDDRVRGPVITLEGALAASMLTQLGKNLFGVCRPRDWSDTTRTCASGAIPSAMARTGLRLSWTQTTPKLNGPGPFSTSPIPSR